MSATPAPNPGQMRLERLQVANWGTFDGHHDVPVPRRGMLLTGESGSGKSSLLDAMSALLIKPGEARFNAAAQDSSAGDRDRSPLSYVRGAYRKQTDEESGEVRPGYLRPGATWSGIALTFSDADGTVFTGVRLFHIPRGAGSSEDLRTCYLAFDTPFDLPAAEDLVATGIDRRRLKAALSPSVITDTYTTFGATLRRRTGIGTEAAQRLLHRTQAAKNLTSLDRLLRDFMLAEPETFTLADTAVEQFGALRDAHAAVVDAREQMEVLTPMREQWWTRLQTLTERSELDVLLEHLGAFRHAKMIERASKDLETARKQRARADAAARAARNEVEAARAADDDARRSRDDRGGAELRQLQLEISATERRRETVDSQVRRIGEVFGRLGVGVPTSADDLHAAQHQAERENRRIAEEAAGLEQQADPQQLRRARAGARIEELEGEISSLTRRRSNLPARLVAARDRIAQQVGIGPAALPFAGELMDITDASWRGAVERVLHPFAQTILVPAEQYREVAAAVDAEHWGTRLQYERVRTDEDTHPPRSLRDGSLVRTLELAEGPFRAWMLRRLVERFDYQLVEDAAQLGAHARAVTRAGQIKTRERHVKDDRFRVEDPERWIIGTSNDQRIELLGAQLRAAREDLDGAQKALRRLHDAHERFRREQSDHDRVLGLEWADIDAPGIQDALAELWRRHASLLSSEDLAVLQQRAEDAARILERARRTEHDTEIELAEIERTITSASADLQKARTELGEEQVPDAVATELAERAWKVRRVLDRQNLAEVVSEMKVRLTEARHTAERRATVAESALATARRRYLERWAERSANLIDDVDATEDFLHVLDRLEADRLPEFETRFRDLLRSQSQNNVGQLSAAISQAIRDVRQRLEPVNESLRATPFDRERQHWLTLVARQHHSGEVRDFLADLQAITERVFSSQEDSLAEAEARFDRIRGVMDALGASDGATQAWRNRVLDTRRHVQFEAQELDAGGEVVDVYKGSDGRSGGQRQRLVTFCLAAALRYQLTSASDGVAPYGVVVLDEAFDKTDIQFTRAGLEVFRSFGFQMVLATPLKMLQTIEEFVGGATVVSNPSGRESRTSTVVFDDPGTGEAAGVPSGD